MYRVLNILGVIPHLRWTALDKRYITFVHFFTADSMCGRKVNFESRVIPRYLIWLDGIKGTPLKDTWTGVVDGFLREKRIISVLAALNDNLLSTAHWFNRFKVKLALLLICLLASPVTITHTSSAKIKPKTKPKPKIS